MPTVWESAFYSNPWLCWGPTAINDLCSDSHSQLKEERKCGRKYPEKNSVPEVPYKGNLFTDLVFGAIAIKTDLWPQIYRLHLQYKCVGHNAMSWNILQEDIWCSDLDSHRPVPPAGHFIKVKMAKYHNYYNPSYSTRTRGPFFLVNFGHFALLYSKFSNFLYILLIIMRFFWQVG